MRVSLDCGKCDLLIDQDNGFRDREQPRAVRTPRQNR